MFILNHLLQHRSSILKVGIFNSFGTILRTHFYFLPYNGLVHPFSILLSFFYLFFEHLALKCSYLSRTSSNDNYDYLFSLLLTNSCN